MPWQNLMQLLTDSHRSSEIEKMPQLELLMKTDKLTLKKSLTFVSNFFGTSKSLSGNSATLKDTNMEHMMVMIMNLRPKLLPKRIHLRQRFKKFLLRWSQELSKRLLMETLPTRQPGKSSKEKSTESILRWNRLSKLLLIASNRLFKVLKLT